MNKLGFCLFGIVWILTLVSMLIFKNKKIVFEWSNGIKIYFEEKDKEDETDEMQ